MNLTTLKNQATTGTYHVHGQVDEADCVIGFSFGYIKTGDKVLPGKSNQQLADFAAEHLASLPMILQYEVAYALDISPSNIFRIEKHRVAGEYLHSQEIAEQAFEIMKRNGWKKAVILAHPYHMPRVDACCQKAGIDTISPKGLEIIDFDPYSEQEWTQSAKLWAAREPEAIDIFAEKGWI